VLAAKQQRVEQQQSGGEGEGVAQLRPRPLGAHLTSLLLLASQTALLSDLLRVSA
jgi:hypothetical protein